jgi:hypothetical protein
MSMSNTPKPIEKMVAPDVKAMSVPELCDLLEGYDFAAPAPGGSPLHMCVPWIELRERLGCPPSEKRAEARRRREEYEASLRAKA